MNQHDTEEVHNIAKEEAESMSKKLGPMAANGGVAGIVAVVVVMVLQMGIFPTHDELRETEVETRLYVDQRINSLEQSIDDLAESINKVEDNNRERINGIRETMTMQMSNHTTQLRLISDKITGLSTDVNELQETLEESWSRREMSGYDRQLSRMNEGLVTPGVD